MNKKHILNLHFTFVCLLFLIGCKHKDSKVNRAFYFWKTSFELNEKELKIIKENNISTLYIKYFDVVWNKELNSTVPVAKILFKHTVPQQLQVVPVVYITNNVLLKCNADSINNLAISISKLIKNYDPVVKNNIAEIQIDCDWTVSTKAKYFKLLYTIKSQFKKSVTISATIRLHQIKYASNTGIPPVQKGMLMYYNMGNLQSLTGNSIFNEIDAEKYAPYIKQYPLPLDVVLPVFKWVKVFRNKQMIKLLNQTSLFELKQTGIFKSIDNHTIEALSTNHYKGFYYVANDIFVEEYMNPNTSLKAAQHLHQYFNSTNFTLALFHLHQPNLNEFTTQDIEALYTTFN
jgi:hypothetical protein